MNSAADRLDVPARAFSSRAEYLATRTNAQYSRVVARCFFLKRGQHRVKHRSGDLVTVVGIVQSEGQNIFNPLNYQSRDGGIRQVKGFLR